MTLLMTWQDAEWVFACKGAVRKQPAQWWLAAVGELECRHGTCTRQSRLPRVALLS